MKEIPELTLQKYILNNFNEFNDDIIRLFNSPIISAFPNYPEDRFPDIFFKLENGKTIPIEVEWKTRKFDHYDHDDFPKFKNNDGLVMVAVKEDDVNLGLEQITVDLDKFEKWYLEYSKQLVKDELKDLRKLLKTKKKRQPRLWVTLLTKKGGALKHFEAALQYETWGIQKNYKVATGKGTRLEEIQKDDLIVFLAGLHGSYKSKKTGKLVFGRYNMTEWGKATFNGKFDYACVFRVSEGYYENNEPKIWKTGSKGKWKDELYPHRFKFNKNPLLIMSNLRVKDLSVSTKSELQNVVYTNFRMCDPKILVDIMHNADQVNVKNYYETLNKLPHLK